MKAGFDLRTVRQDAFRDVQARGQLAFTPFAYTGNGLADLLLGLPTITVGASLDNPQRLRTENVGFFVQDQWRATSTLTLTAGLRYELTSPPVDAEDRATVYDQATGRLVQVGTGGVPRAGYETDRNNFAPRLGFAWSATPETVVRGAYGIYYNLSALAPSEGLYFSDPYFHLDFFFPAQGLPPLTLYDPFPENYPIPSPQSGFTFQRDLETPYLQHFSVGVQRQLGATRSVEATYVGSRGSSLVTGRDLNQPRPSTMSPNLRPNPFFGDITILESAGRSEYNSLQLKFEQRSVNGVSVLGAYTLARSEDDASGFFPSAGDPNYPQDSQNMAAEFGRSSFDVRHRLSVGLVWDIPSGDAQDGVVGLLLSDWQVSGVLTLQSGRPFTVALLQEIDNSNTGRANLGFGYNDRPNVTGDPDGVRPDRRALVQHRRLCVPGLRDLRQLGPQHGGGAGLPEREPGVDEAAAAWLTLEAAAAAGSVQPVQPHELQSAGQLPGVADLRADPVGAEPATVSAGREGVVLDHKHNARRKARCASRCRR